MLVRKGEIVNERWVEDFEVVVSVVVVFWGLWVIWFTGARSWWLIG